MGRAGQKSACLLTFGDPLTEEAEARLQALCDTDDGFRLAERDLELRGAGHLFGYRQSGASGLRFANLVEDRALLRQAAALVFHTRKNFATTAFFDAKARTDASGRAEVSIKLPENLTTFRINAVAMDTVVTGSSGSAISTSAGPETSSQRMASSGSPAGRRTGNRGSPTFP